MTNLDFQMLESSYTLGRDIVHETWFITRKGWFSSLPPVRRDVYKAEDGSVVAFKDTGINVDKALYMDEEFLMFFAGEPELDVIMADQGITDTNLIKTFRLE